MAQIKKKWTRSISFNKFDCLEIHAVGQVFLLTQPRLGNVDPGDRLVTENIGPEIGAIANAFHLRSELRPKTVSGRANFHLRSMKTVTTQMPLTNHAGYITSILHPLGNSEVAR